MTIFPLNKVTPGTGTPVAVNVNDIAVDRCNKLAIIALPDNPGKVFIGTATMNTATLAGVFEVLQPGERAVIADETQSNVIQINKIFLKGENAGDAVLASAYVR